MSSKKNKNKLFFQIINHFVFVQIRAEILKVLFDFYQKIPTAKYYEVASFNYKHGKIK
jgi:hypothetical protein